MYAQLHYSLHPPPPNWHRHTFPFPELQAFSHTQGHLLPHPSPTQLRSKIVPLKLTSFFLVYHNQPNLPCSHNNRLYYLGTIALMRTKLILMLILYINYVKYPCKVLSWVTPSHIPLSPVPSSPPCQHSLCTMDVVDNILPGLNEKSELYLMYHYANVYRDIDLTNDPHNNCIINSQYYIMNTLPVNLGNSENAI